MKRFVALLRGINVGGRAPVPMAELRALTEQLGWAQVQTYIQSGNLVFAAAGADARHEEALEGMLAARFGAAYPVIVRSADQWAKLAATNPFAEAAEQEPSRLMLLVSKSEIAPDAAEAVQARGRDGERVAAVPGGLWIHYPGGSGTSKLTPSLVDRLIGSPATSRNYRTVQMLAEMLGS
jgi:uncharacterized protein (DUF1697 family)